MPEDPPVEEPSLVELGVGTEPAPRAEVEVQTDCTPTPRRQLFVSPTMTASPSGEEVSPDVPASSGRRIPPVPPI